MAEKTNTVNISFRKDLLKAIDEVAEKESRSRSELIREAARMYIERKDRWEAIFTTADQAVSARNLTEMDVDAEIAAYRNQSRRKR
jgi:CopG family transcriptional regulator / antitoxin EndoAI